LETGKYDKGLKYGIKHYPLLKNVDNGFLDYDFTLYVVANTTKLIGMKKHKYI